MTAPKSKDGDGHSRPPPEDSDEILLPGDDAPPIVLRPGAPPVPTDDPIEFLLEEPAIPAGTALRPPSPGSGAAPAIIDDRPDPNSPSGPQAQPEYTTEPPLVASDRVREPFDLPTAARPARQKPSPPSPWPRRAALVTVGAILAFGAWAAFSRLRPDPPVIASIVPAKAEPGQTVTIAGTALGADAEKIVVRFGDLRGPVTSATESSLAATIPAELANLPPGAVRVIVEVNGMTSNALFMTVTRYPKITGIEPEVALPGAEVAITGVNLEGEAIAVRIGGLPAEVVGRNGEGLRVKVPPMPVIEGQAVAVDVSLGSEAAHPGTLFLGHLPLVTGLAPASGEVGTTVTIKGYGFAPRIAGNRVTFGTLDALVLAASEREIQAVVPGLGIIGSRTELRAVVSTGAARSAPFEFTVVRPSGDVFRPRFVAAPALGGDPERHAVVGTELGPVLVLTGRADAPSIAERAAGVAFRLNTLQQAAANQPVVLEVKEGPLQIAAGGATVVTVTADDAEGVSRGGDGVRGARISAPALARYWAALLQDYLGLFGQRVRPNRVIELTPQAWVLLDIYSDAERRGGSAGVNTRIVTEMPPNRLDALRRLAYAGPDEAHASRGMALAGAWEGTLEEGGRPRPIRLQVRLDGARLAGAMTSTAGTLEMAIPLHDLRYDKGMVRWSAVLAGTPMQFQGALEGATLNGTVHSTGAAAAAGRFTLRHVE